MCGFLVWVWEVEGSGCSNQLMKENLEHENTVPHQTPGAPSGKY